MRIFFAHGGGEAFARWREEQGQTLQDWATWAAIAEEHGGDWHTWPEELRRPHGPGARPLRRAARRRRRLPRLAAVGAGPAVHRRHRRHDRDPGPADRRRRRRRRRLGLAGRARRGRQRRRAAGRVQLAGPGLGLAAADPVAAARRRLRAVHPVDPRHHRRRRRPADRPRHGAVPAVVGAGRRLGRRGRLRPLPGRGPARHRRAGEPPRAGARRRRGPRHGRGRRPRGHGRARRSCPTGCSGSRTTTPPSGRPRRWPPITTHDLPTVAGLWTGADVEEQREHGTGTDEELERGRTSLLGHLPKLPDGAPVEEAVEQAHRRLAEAPSLLLSATLDDAVGEQRRPNMPGHHRPAELVAAAAGAGRGPARPPAACRRWPAPSADGDRRELS